MIKYHKAHRDAYKASCGLLSAFLHTFPTINTRATRKPIRASTTRLGKLSTMIKL